MKGTLALREAYGQTRMSNEHAGHRARTDAHTRRVARESPESVGDENKSCQVQGREREDWILQSIIGNPNHTAAWHARELHTRPESMNAVCLRLRNAGVVRGEWRNTSHGQECGLFITEAGLNRKPVAPSVRSIVLGVIRGRPGLNTNELCAALNMRKKALQSHLGRLTLAGLLRSEKPTDPTHPARYFIAA